MRDAENDQKPEHTFRVRPDVKETNHKEHEEHCSRFDALFESHE